MCDFLFIGIGVFGFSYLVRYLNGPFDILKKFREFVGIHYIPILNDDSIEDGEVEEISDLFFAKLVGCFWCLSTWVSIFMCSIYSIVHVISVFDAFTGIFICVGISGFVHEIVGFLEN